MEDTLAEAKNQASTGFVVAVEGAVARARRHLRLLIANAWVGVGQRARPSLAASRAKQRLPKKSVQRLELQWVQAWSAHDDNLDVSFLGRDLAIPTKFESEGEPSDDEMTNDDDQNGTDVKIEDESSDEDGWHDLGADDDDEGEDDSMD